MSGFFTVNHERGYSRTFPDTAKGKADARKWQNTLPEGETYWEKAKDEDALYGKAERTYSGRKKGKTMARRRRARKTSRRRYSPRKSSTKAAYRKGYKAGCRAAKKRSRKTRRSRRRR